MNDLITIGQFSKMTRLSVKALRLYDDTALLQPAWVDPSSGYRYYRLGQANRAEAIRILRSVEMPLDEIGAVLAHDDPALVRKALTDHRARLTQRLADQQRMLRFLEQLIERKDGVMPYDITTKQLPDQTVAAVRRTTTLATISNAIESGFATLMGYLGPHGIEPAGAPVVVYPDVIDTETAGDIDVCLPVASPVDGDEHVRSLELPGGTVASTIHHGPYDEIRPAYHTLMGWMQEHDHEPSAPPREIYLNDPSQVPPDELLTEVAWPIR